MIYELVDECIASLANQWRDLVASFQQLAASLPAIDLRVPLVGTQAPLPAPAPAGSFQANAEAERLRVDTARSGIVSTRPVAQMFADATLLFQVTEGVRAPMDLTPLFGLPSGSDSVPLSVCRAALDDLGSAIAGCLQEFDEITSAEGTRFSLSGIKGSVADISSYPLWTAEIGTVGPGGPAVPSPAGAGNLQQLVDATFREVLGRLPKPKDTRSFVLALGQSFELETVEGHTSFSWTPRAYGGETELAGAVTGAQASLYSRAKVSLANSLPALEGLYPLLPDADPQLVEAARSIVRTEMIQVTDELGREGGPRIARVDELFDSLLARVIVADGGLQVIGQLGYLQEIYGLYANRVNTLEEEANVTSYLVLRDYVLGDNVSWVTFRDQFYGMDLGTRLVLLARALSVVAESVDETYAAMDSVFVGSAERQVATFRGAGHDVLVEDLLAWISTFASDEAPQLVQEGGRRGAEAIVPTTIRLRELLDELLQAIPNEPSLPDGLKHPRVQNPLQELRDYLLQVQRYAQQVR